MDSFASLAMTEKPTAPQSGRSHSAQARATARFFGVRRPRFSVRIIQQYAAGMSAVKLTFVF
jgi:hypothetical protein